MAAHSKHKAIDPRRALHGPPASLELDKDAEYKGRVRKAVAAMAVSAVGLTVGVWAADNQDQPPSPEQVTIDPLLFVDVDVEPVNTPSPTESPN